MRVSVSRVANLVPVILALASAGALAAWVGYGPAVDLPEDRAGRAGGPPPSARTRPAELNGRLTRGDAEPADLLGDWPQFRGPDRDGASPESVRLADSWPTGGPPVLWSLELGEGHAGPAVLNGCVYLLDYDRASQADALRCLSLADGKEIWRYGYPVVVKRNHGMSRTVAAVSGRFVVTLGPKCQVLCCDASTGQLLWWKDLVGEYGAKVPLWYAGQCPLIDQERAILAPGGKALMVAVDCATGRTIWETPNPRKWSMTHSSIMPMEFAGKRQYVYCGSGGVAGVSAEDGTILWDTTDWKISTATVPSPVIVGGGRIFLSGGYGVGSLMLQLKQVEDRIVPETLFRLKPEVFGATQHTPILHNDLLYGVRPDGQLVCLDLAGQVVWTSGPENRFGIGPFLLADEKLLLMDDHGLITLAEAGREHYRQLAQAKVLPGPDSWGPLAIADGRLLARDLTRMVCLDLRAP